MPAIERAPSGVLVEVGPALDPAREFAGYEADARAAVFIKRPGDSVTVEVVRDGRAETFTLTLAP